MKQRLTDYQVFLREFRQTFHTTGAMLPSGAALARAIAGQLALSPAPRVVLEAGPGTGAVTGHLIQQLGPDDRLDLVELNERFANVLRERLASDPAWRGAENRVRVLNMALEDLQPTEKYDTIVSGLPLNNFSCELVESLFTQFHRLAAEGATLSFFEYVGIRKVKSLWSNRDERQRLAGIDRIFARELSQWEKRRDFIAANFPPAWVHHLRLPGAASLERGELVGAAT